MRSMSQLVSMLALTLVASHSLAVEGTNEQACTRGEASGVLAVRPGSPKPKFEKVGKFETKEVTAVDDHTELTVRNFGCSHYDLEFSFLLRGQKAASHDVREWRVRAAELLTKVEVVDGQKKAMQRIVAALRTDIDAPYQYGDGLTISEMETVSLVVKSEPSGVRLALLYDVAL